MSADPARTSARAKVRTTRRRRGLRIFLWTAGLFLVFQLLGGLVLDYWWMRARYPFQSDMYARLNERLRTPEIFVFGSSRFMGGLQCEVLDGELRRTLGDGAPRTFNASLPGADGTVFERVFDDVMRRGRRPKLVVLEVSPETVGSGDLWLKEQALRLLDWRDVPEASLALARNGKIMYLLRGRLLPLYLHRYQIRKEVPRLFAALFRPDPLKPPYDPPVPPPLLAEPEPPVLTQGLKSQLDKAGEIYLAELSHYRVGGMTSRRLERLLERCRSMKVPVLLVGAPVPAPQRRAYTPEVEGAFRGYMNQLAARFDCVFVDWRHRVPDNYFVDGGGHLHPAGALYFSQRLAKEDLALAWREQVATPGLSARRDNTRPPEDKN